MLRGNYTLVRKTGCTIKRMECYDGYNMQYYYIIFAPTGEEYMRCGSYKEALEMATHYSNKEV